MLGLWRGILYGREHNGKSYVATGSKGIVMLIDNSISSKKHFFMCVYHKGRCQYKRTSNFFSITLSLYTIAVKLFIKYLFYRGKRWDEMKLCSGVGNHSPEENFKRDSFMLKGKKRNNFQSERLGDEPRMFERLDKTWNKLSF